MNFKTYKTYVKNKKNQERKRIIQVENLTEVKDFLRKKFDYTNIDEIKFVNKVGKTIARCDLKTSDFFVP